MGRAWVAVLLLGLGGCTFQGELEDYCQGGRCECTDGRCCLGEGQRCQEGLCCEGLACSASGVCRRTGLPVLQLQPPGLDLSVGAPGQEASGTIEVLNTGYGPSDPLEVTLAGDATLRLEADGCSARPLEAGARCQLTVRFRPTAAAPSTATVRVVGSTEAPEAHGRVRAAVGERLVVQLSGAPGTLTSTPPGIDCPGTCEATFSRGTQVALQASAQPGIGLVALEGGGCPGGSPCTLTVDGGVLVTARFAPWLRVRVAAPTAAPRDPYDLPSLGGVAGAAADGGVCTGSCERMVVGPVTLEAQPTAGNGFAGWAGACADAGSTRRCQLDVSGPREVVAQLVPRNAVFVTKRTLVPAALGGSLVDADRLCAQEALAHELPVNLYRALLAQPDGGPAEARLQGARGFATPVSYYAPTSLPLADLPEDLVAGRLRISGAIPIAGSYGTTPVLTGLEANGTVNPQGLCSGWTSDAGSVWPGHSDGGAAGWLRDTRVPAQDCGQPLPVYCVGTLYRAAMAADGGAP